MHLARRPAAQRPLQQRGGYTCGPVCPPPTRRCCGRFSRVLHARRMVWGQKGPVLLKPGLPGCHGRQALPLCFRSERRGCVTVKSGQSESPAWASPTPLPQGGVHGTSRLSPTHCPATWPGVCGGVPPCPVREPGGHPQKAKFQADSRPRPDSARPFGPQPWSALAVSACAFPTEQSRAGSGWLSPAQGLGPVQEAAERGHRREVVHRGRQAGASSWDSVSGLMWTSSALPLAESRAVPAQLVPTPEAQLSLIQTQSPLPVVSG